MFIRLRYGIKFNSLSFTSKNSRNMFRTSFKMYLSKVLTIAHQQAQNIYCLLLAGVLLGSQFDTEVPIKTI
jgi:hypothetical protein